MIPRSELLQIVVEDLFYLREQWNESIEDSALRRGSAVLRQLLVQNELQRAWRMAGFKSQPSITASTLEPILNRIPLNKIKFASAGGAKYRGAEQRGILLVNFAMSEEEIKRDYKAGVPSATMKLKEFIEAPCIVISGELITRHILIKFIANKKGGVHFDTKRTPDERLFSLLDSIHDRLKLLDKRTNYFELLSIGQALASSEDIETFLREVG